MHPSEGQFEMTYVFKLPPKGPVQQIQPDTSPPPTHEAIAQRAYDIYLESGSLEGRCHENWCQAVLEMNREP